MNFILYVYLKKVMSKIRPSESMTITFPIAKVLKEKGYAVGSNSHYHIYDDDFIYDGDESHPESHKKGEVRLYDFYSHNKDNDKNSYENAPIILVIYWLLIKGIIFNICLNDDMTFHLNLKKFSIENNQILLDENFPIDEKMNMYEAYLMAISKSLEFV